VSTQQTTNKTNDSFLLCGDFNFDSERNYNADDGKPLENESIREFFGDYIDVWPTVNSHDDGKTFDTERNTMLRQPMPERMRYDRILLKSHRWRPAAMELIGTSAFMTDGIVNPLDVFPSDHFGLYLELQWVD